MTTMVDNIVEKLMGIGLSQYEARAYIALLEKNPVTAYELAKASGIPTSKIYAVLSKLSEKDMVSAMGEEGAKKYVPKGPDEFIDGHKHRIETTLDSLRDDLASVRKGPDVSYIWNIGDYDYLMSKAIRMIVGSEKTLLVSVWREELELLEQVIKKAEELRNVRVSIIHFGTTVKKLGHIFQHPIEDTIYSEKGGRGLVIVSDSKEVLVGTVMEGNKVEGAWSMNRGFVMLAEDYIKHDIYIMKIVRRFDGVLRSKFGRRYEKLRDIFRDEEVA